MDPAQFRHHGHALVDWVAEYLARSDRFPVLARVAPGDLKGSLPQHAPEQGEAFGDIFADFERLIVPALTHWNHPGFFAYFATSSTGPAVLAELLAAAVNQQAMLWRTSPAATELEEVTLGWLRDLVGLPEAFEGVIYDTASMSTLHALAAARESALPDVRQHGLQSVQSSRPRVYCSDQAHSSVDKAVILLGLGHEALDRIPVDDRFAMRADALRSALDRDLAQGARPVAVVATLGTTSTTSVDPVNEIANICRERGVWLHVDAAYAGAAALLPDCRERFEGWQHADSVVINPHKWLFVPVDLSALYCRRMDVLRRAFSLVPDFLQTPEGSQGVRNLMDTGIQLGRRFRALKLWMVLRHFGATGIRALLAEHIRLAQRFADWVGRDPDFELVAPAPFSVVCFRARPRDASLSPDELDRFNERLLETVNASGEVFLSHTRLRERFVLRLAVGHIRTTETHVARAFALLKDATSRLVREP